MAVHSFTLVPAAYVVLLRETGPGEADDVTGASPSARTEVLLQLRRNTGYMDGYWACGAAGHVEASEAVTATAVREAREELGVEVAAHDLVPLTAVHRTNGSPEPVEQRVDFFLSARTWRGEPTAAEGAKNAGIRWFALAALPERVPPHERMVLALLAGALDGGAPIPAVTTFGFRPGEEIDRYRAALPH